MKQLFFYALSAAFLVFTACTEPITVGSDLLDGDRATVGQTMTVPFNTRVVREDSIRSFFASANQVLSTFTFGQLNDEVFGKRKNSAYLVPFLPRQSGTGVPIRPSFAFTPDAAEVDSVVFIMPIDTNFAFYGTERNFSFRAGRVTERISDEMDYFTDIDLGPQTEFINENSIFSASTTPALLYDTIYSPSGTDSLLQPHIRIRMNDAFLAEVNGVTQTVFNSDSTLAELIAGIYIEPQDDVDGLVSLEPQRAGALSNAGFHFFYKDTTAAQTPRRYQLRLSLWLPRYENDFAGSLTGDLLEDGLDSMQIALAGQGGTMTEITFPDLSALEDKVINRARFTFFRQAIEDYSYNIYESPSFVGLYFRNNAGLLQPISDFIFLTEARGGDFLRSISGGGEQTDDDGNTFYSPALSLHLQNIVEGIAPNKIYLRVVPFDRDPARVILKGSGDAELPANLEVTFTELGG